MQQCNNAPGMSCTVFGMKALGKNLWGWEKFFWSVEKLLWRVQNKFWSVQNFGSDIRKLNFLG